MLSLANAQDQVRDRGPQFAVIGTIRRDETKLVLTDTAQRAEEAAEGMRSDGLRGVKLHPPRSDVDHRAVARELADARRQIAEATKVARASAHRLVESGLSEVATAELLGVTRMTVRDWLGKS